MVIAALASGAKIPLTGYFCATCPANPDPMDLFNSIHPAYSTVILAFAGWNDAGNVVNQWDCDATCSKNFTLTKGLVEKLKVLVPTINRTHVAEPGQNSAHVSWWC